MKRDKTPIRRLQSLLAKIPRGNISTYKIIAERLGVNPRHAGWLLGKNDKPDTYPCYKIVMSDGRIGGYALGVSEKIRRLKGDGLVIQHGRVAHFDKKVYKF